MLKRDRIRWALLSLLLASAVRAESSSAVVVWYRAAGECPQGPEFIGQFLGRTRLAEAGDHIDFVVTLLAANGETVGRLERQTESGTVAIRELRDPNCSRVADALALSLALSLEPGKARSAPAAPAASTASTAPSAPPVSATPVSATPAPAPAPTQTAPPSWPSVGSERAPEPSARATPRASELRGGWLGLQGGALLGLAPQALARSAVFLGLEDPWPEFVSGSALRLAAVGALGSVSTSVGDVQQWLLAGRAEGCPVRWGRPTLSVAPCLAFELGATGASAEGTTLPGDTGLWVAAGAGLRGALRLMPKLLLEAQAEAQLPLYRNDVYAGQEAVYRAESLAFQGGLGLSMRLW